MGRMPIVTYDTNARVFSVELDRGKVARTVEFDDSHLVDLSSDGRVLSIEILTPENPSIEDMAARFGFEDRVPEILEAVEAALAPRLETGSSSGFQKVQGSSRVIGGETTEGRSAGEIPPRKITLV